MSNVFGFMVMVALMAVAVFFAATRPRGSGTPAPGERDRGAGTDGPGENRRRMPPWVKGLLWVVVGLLAVRGFFIVLGAAADAHRAQDRLDAAMGERRASGIMQAQLDKADAWAEVFTAIPLAGGAIRDAVKRAWDDERESLARVREVEIATDRMALVAEDWKRQADEAMRRAEGR